MSRWRQLLDDERGASDITALVLLAPVTVAIVALIVWTSRQVDAQAQVRTTAEAAAQAAARERDPDSAAVAASRIVERMAGSLDACPTPTATVDVANFAPGGTVSVTVTCTPSTRNVETAHPSAVVYSATAVAVIDRYRSGPLP